MTDSPHSPGPQFGKWKTLLCLLLLAGICFVPHARAQTLSGWILVWSDEFDQPDGSAPDPAKWNHDVGGHGWGNSEWQFYTDRTNNSRIENGKLVIEAIEENFGGRSYTSARLLTQNKHAWLYGRIEARIKVPRGQGIWPAFWMLGDNFDPIGWPDCGEIDIMEHIGREPRTVYGTIHGPGYSGGNGVSGSTTTRTDVAEQFHVFAIEWETNRIRWFLNDYNYFTATPESLGGATWVFDHPHFILLNLAVGGLWPGYPDETTVFPQRLLVDYVRVYIPSNAPPTSSGSLINGDFETGSLAPWIGANSCCANPQGGNIVNTNGLVWDPVIDGNNTQGIRNPAFGEYSCKVYGNFSGGPNTPGFHQDVTAVPGSVWTATIKARTQNTDHIRDSNQAVAEVSFLGAANTVLAKYTSEVFDTSIPIDTWIDMDVMQQVFPVIGTTNQLHAPSGTEKVRFAVTFSQNLYEWGSIYFDDARLEEIAGPPAILPPRLNASLNEAREIEISFATQPGVSYEVLYRNNLNDTGWTAIETIAGDGTTKSVSYPTETPSIRLYAIQAE